MAEEIINVEQLEQTSTKPMTEQQASLNRISEEFNFALPSSSATKNMTEETSKYTYPTQLTNSVDRENWTVSTDHCYARPWNWKPETNFLRPTKSLFVPKLVPEIRKSCHSEEEDLIDVTSGPELPTPMYDINKARNSMDECEKQAFAIRPSDDEDWEEKVSKLNWNNTQHRVFNATVSILNSYSLTKLAQTGVHNEPLLRRIAIDKAVQRVRRLIASVTWDTKITQWLHQLLIDNLDSHYLACYFDILQTLKSKLPVLFEKLIHGTASRVGALSNSSLLPILEKNWEPVVSTLTQDKPKKLPGNPIIVVVPSGPTMTKMQFKWIQLLSQLTTVVTVPTHFGSSACKLTMPAILEQLFTVTKGKIQDVRLEHPGRPIVLFGYRAGATLALQIAQVESVLCVVSAGFSASTAEGVRGEPDDNLLELQCPVLFVVGQCSNAATQESMEDLRERMRVETGLIVVGSADDFLKITKKKRRAEGITQSFVDRCIIDEMGEFISSLILSPYPPHVRQSPTSVVAVEPPVVVKKGKSERKRYNSNTSSLDSEPPSPTPPIPKRPVGRPPGTKSKNRLGLEAKWAQQIAQGNTNNPTSHSPPPPYPITTTPDTSSNDSSLPDRQLQPPKSAAAAVIETANVRKIKTIKPTLVADKSATSTSSGKSAQVVGPARMQAYGMNRAMPPHGGTLSTLLQGGIKTIPPSQPKSGIKVLENVTLNSGSTAKLLHNRTIDLSKLTLVNSVKGTSTSMNNVLLLPDGKLKSVHGSTIKGTGGTPILLPLSPQKMVPRRNKYITAKRQQKPPHLSKKPFYLPSSTVAAPHLPPPTALTTEDIMDLPIIFADDNQILDSNVPTTTKPLTLTASGKYLLVNKPLAGQTFKKQPPPMTFNKSAPKYTKIILSKKTNVLKPGQLPAPSVEPIDLENEIRATAVPKPNLASSFGLGFGEGAVGSKRSSGVVDDGDPDYIPPKNAKLE